MLTTSVANSAEQFSRFIDREPFITAAGLRSNQKYNLDKVSRESHLYYRIIDELAEWALGQEVAVVTAVPNGGTRYGRDTARRAGLPFAAFKKRNGVFIPYYDVAAGHELLKDGAKAGEVEDVRSTGSSAIKLARKITGEVVACAIVDRGQDVDGVKSAHDSGVYAQLHPTEPPAHIQTDFSYDSLLHLPLGLWNEAA